MKHISMLILVIAVLAFASCAHHESAPNAYQGTTTGTGYSK